MQNSGCVVTNFFGNISLSDQQLKSIHNNMVQLFDQVLSGEIDPIRLESAIKGLFPLVNPLCPVEYFPDLLKSYYFRRSDNINRLQIFLVLTSRASFEEKNQCFVKIIQGKNSIIPRKYAL